MALFYLFTGDTLWFGVDGGYSFIDALAENPSKYIGSFVRGIPLFATIAAGMGLTYGNLRRQLAESLENKPFPTLPEDLQERIYFEFGSSEDHYKYRDAVMNAYPHGNYTGLLLISRMVSFDKVCTSR